MMHPDFESNTVHKHCWENSTKLSSGEYFSFFQSVTEVTTGHLFSQKGTFKTDNTLYSYRLQARKYPNTRAILAQVTGKM